MKVISSKNTWYLIFGILFIVIITALAFRLIFKRTEEKLSGTTTNQTQTNRPTLVGQTSTKSDLTYTRVSPTPTASPKAQTSGRSFFTLFDTASPSPSLANLSASPNPSPSPSLTDQHPQLATATGTLTTKGGELTVITNPDGTTYLGTKKADGSTDSAKTRTGSGLSTLIRPPKGYATDLGLYINQILRVVLVISALLVFAQLIWGGLEWITSGGDKKKVDDARNKIIAAVIGLIIVASSFAILQLALNFIGYDSINELLRML